MFAGITWTLLALSLLLLFGMLLYLRREKNRTKDVRNKKESKIAKNEDFKIMWEVEGIKNGVIELSSFRYRIIMRLASADFFLLSADEQTSVEDCLISVMMGLSFPVQILITSEAVDTRTIVNEIRENLPNLNNKMRDYAGKLITHMEGLKSLKTAAMRSAYVVIPFETDKGHEYAHTELMARVGSLTEGLKTAKISCAVLPTEGVVDLLHHLFNRGKLWRPSEADEVGVMELYHISERQVYVKHVQTA